MGNEHINIHIDRLVLEGITIPGHRQPVLQGTVETELARLLANGGIAGGVGGVDEVDGVGEIHLTGNEEHNPILLGQQIARSVYKQKFLQGLRGRFFQKEPPGNHENE